MQYAFKKVSTTGEGNDMVSNGGQGLESIPDRERHGSHAESMLAAANPHGDFLSTKKGLGGQHAYKRFQIQCLLYPLPRGGLVVVVVQ